MSAARSIAEAALGHPVPHLLADADDAPVVAASITGDPPRARVAWVARDGSVLARVACPPGRPSRWRPLVAAVVTLDMAPTIEDRVLVVRAADEASAIVPILATESPSAPVEVGEDGLVLVRLPADTAVIAVDALDASGEPIGRLARSGVAELRFDGSTVSGRLGATHGMAAGVGAGRWAHSLADAAFEVGYDPWLPAWIPTELSRGRPRVEPDVSYPAAPPALVLAWTGDDGARILLRQAPAPLASPDTGGRGARQVQVGEWPGVLRGRGLVTLVWEGPERAFGLQVRGVPEAEDIAMRVALSISPRTLS